MTIPTLNAKSFYVGPYLVLAAPMNGSAQMLRYTVFLEGKRLGAMASQPSESDCKALASPVDAPPPVAWQGNYWRGRPK